MVNVKQKYIKDKKINKMLYRFTIVFFMVYIILPQYFGLNTPGFDLTAQRITIIIGLLLIVDNYNSISRFRNTVLSIDGVFILFMYLFICFYTAIFRRHIGTFFYPLIEITGMILFIYFANNHLGLNKCIIIIKRCIYFLSIMGIIEYFMRKTPFAYLETIRGLYTGGMIRSGSYRIMGPANHALGYGLMLVTFIAIAAIDIESNQISIIKNKWLLVLLLINVFLCGSRSSLAIALLEYGLLFLFNEKSEKRKTFFFLFICVLVFLLFIVVFQKTPIAKYFLLQITSLIDEVFDTTYSINFGADINTLNNSSDYREFLPQIFSLSFLNPILGRGSGYHFSWYTGNAWIQSIDNFYVAEYIRLGYPGMIVYTFWIILLIGSILWHAKKYKSGFCYAIAIGSICYYVCLWWVDTLQTIKYVYILFAIFILYKLNMKKEERIEEQEEKTYIKKFKV